MQTHGDPPAHILFHVLASIFACAVVPMEIYDPIA